MKDLKRYIETVNSIDPIRVGPNPNLWLRLVIKRYEEQRLAPARFLEKRAGVSYT